MPVDLSIRIIGDKQLARSLGRFGTSIKNWRPFWGEVGYFLRERAKQVFATEGATGGTGPWEPLSPGYEARKGLTHPGRGILVRSGALRSSLTVEEDPYHIERKRQTQFTFGSRLLTRSGWQLAELHMTGTDRMPARPPLVLTENDKQAVTREALQYIMRIAKAVGIQVESFTRRGQRVTVGREISTGRFAPV